MSPSIYLFLPVYKTKLFLIIFPAIDNLKSPLFQVDIANVQTNILLIQILDPKISSADLTNRLFEVSSDELKNGVSDENGKEIIVKLSARDWSFARIVCYPQITEEDVDLAIKKIVFVFREFESKV